MYFSDNQFRLLTGHVPEEGRRLGFFRFFELYVFENDGNIPRFHLLNRLTCDHAAVSLLNPEYIGPHGYEFGPFEAADLEKYLDSTADGESGTVFERLVKAWNGINRAYVCDSYQPRYRFLSDKAISAADIVTLQTGCTEKGA